MGNGPGRDTGTDAIGERVFFPESHVIGQDHPFGEVGSDCVSRMNRGRNHPPAPVTIGLDA